MLLTAGTRDRPLPAGFGVQGVETASGTGMPDAAAAPAPKNHLADPVNHGTFPPAMATPVKYLLTLIALLAVGSAQVLGIGKGWLCHCSGAAEFSTAADCAEADCHHHHDAGGGHTDGHSHQHELLREPLQSTGFVPVVPAPPAVMELILPEWLQPLPVHGRKLAEAPDEARPPPEDQGTCRHLRVSVAMSMVLLV